MSDRNEGSSKEKVRDDAVLRMMLLFIEKEFINLRVLVASFTLAIALAVLFTIIYTDKFQGFEMESGAAVGTLFGFSLGFLLTRER